MKKYGIVVLDSGGNERLMTFYDRVDYQDKLLDISYYGFRVVSKFSYNI